MEYMKTWQDIMSGKKILYVHGFASSGQSGTVTLLRTIFPNATVVAPDLPIHPQEAMDLLHATCDEERPDLIIGSSMGGMMTEMLYGYDRILVNPAFQMGDTMGSHGMVGKLSFQNPRRDGVQEMIVTKAIVKEYRELTAQCFNPEKVKEDKARVWGLFGDNDPVVHTRDIFLEHYPKGITFHGEHRLIDTVVHHALVPVVRWIDDRQEKRQRETVYIDFECLHNDRMQATPSMHKAVEALLDNYTLYFVAPSPTNDTPYYKVVTDWMQEYVTVPAHDHIIFTNNPELLYGDFFISPCPPKDGMATPIEYGSDTFKTWEEIITYFSRLTN
ncbi:esterase [Prevotella sp. PINT]|jgi:Predicted esterase|uniref:YqiA/YcfP family alpha/beta fold hydrolase n=1 Tax=Palleniella intestinalis TaxID=2736291 RepID=UPI0015563906|nr:YqiA/YcfP family alpha/beta fold hydrolase [Palleniella intestinalis]NPD81775.1 esterase [Palleniella intestinalis]